VRARHCVSIKVAITVNLAISVAVLVTSLIRRWESGALDDASGWGVLVVAILAGNMVGAWLGVRSAHRARDPKLARAMRLYLFAIGLLFSTRRSLTSRTWTLTGTPPAPSASPSSAASPLAGSPPCSA
jgi:uncharacterized membrane protein YfcA